MLNKGMKLTTVKNQMKNRFNWWKLHEERKFPTGEINLYYKHGKSTLVIFFDFAGRLGDTAYFEEVSQ